MPSRAIPTVILVAGVFIAIVALIVLFGFGGWEYYRAPLGTRGYLPEHRWLRPSGRVGLLLGVAGTVGMIATLPYYIRKRWGRLAGVGSLKTWLDVHIFFGIVAPLLITLHTSFKFNGLISVGYWLLMIVWASGFVGRYLYVRLSRQHPQLERTRRLFELWHVFHRPLVAIVFVIVAIHVGVALYLGYAQFWTEAS